MAEVQIELKNFSFTYAGESRPALDSVSVKINAGEFVTLCGLSGSGKSTLLRQLKTSLVPHGSVSGAVFFEGKPLAELSLREQTARIGFVQQSPEHQIVTDTVWHELSFALESLGEKTPVIRRRVAETAAYFGIEDWFYRKVSTLSGGQKQILSLASVMTLSPAVLILDEPTAQLDPIAAAEFFSLLQRVNRELGTTVLLSEHRLEEAFPLSDRVMVLDNGRLLCQGTPKEAGEFLRQKQHPMTLALPVPMRVWAAVANPLPCPVTVRQGRDWLRNFANQYPLKNLPPEELPERGDALLTAKDLWFRYEKNGNDIIKGVSLSLHRGEITALCGGNGTGKSTLLRLLAGLGKPYRGTCLVKGRTAALPQDPQTVFVRATVRADLAEQVKDMPPEEGERRMKQVTALCMLGLLLDRHPYDLSGGEQQRAALAKVLLTAPDILLLDEPTKGLDSAFQAMLVRLLHRLAKQGMAILIVSHDTDFCAGCAHRCLLMFDGGIAAEGSPREFFSGNRFYTTAANRMARETLPEAIRAEEIVFACGGEMPKEPPFPTEEDFSLPPPLEKKPIESPRKEKKNKTSRRAILSSLFLLVCIPLTLWAGMHVSGSRPWYAVSLLILLESMLPFFLVFEGRKPKARELVTLAVLCALGVAGRAAFFFLPQGKPVTALSVLTGAVLGPESGFLVGAMTILASNLLFGQGPWTPWQMFAMGMIGALAGLLFRNRTPSKTVLCVFGFLAAIVVYGGIMNPASALLWMDELNGGILLACYAAGLPMDLLHGGFTAAFLWLAAEPMGEKLKRIREKYGLLTG